ncbi:MAG: hypothetical protein RIT81_24695 [Deltaproteobacteria bacterium]
MAPDAELVGDLSGRHPFAVQAATDPATARRETLREELLEPGDGFTLPDLLFGSRVRGGQLRIRVEEVVELAALRAELTRADVSELAVRDHPHVTFEGRPPTRIPGGERPRAIVEEHQPNVLFEVVAIEAADTSVP